MRQIQLKRHYLNMKGQDLKPGLYDVTDPLLGGLASYLIENGYAIELDPAPVIEEAPEADPESLSDLRNRYKELAGKGASPKWDAETLREKIEALEDAESDNPGL